MITNGFIHYSDSKRDKRYTKIQFTFLYLFVIILLLISVCCQQNHFDLYYKLNDFQKSLVIDSLYFYNYGKSNCIAKPTFCIASWNIQQGRNIDKQIEYLHSLNPDIVCLQEVDWNNERTNKENIVNKISNALEMNSCYGIEFIEIKSQNRKTFRFIGEGGGAIGNAILSRTDLYDCSRIPLTTKNLDWENPVEPYQKKIVSIEPRIGQRIALKANTLINGKNIVIVCTHLEDKGGGIAGRIEQLNQIFASLVNHQNDPIIIAGDFNTYAHGAALLVLRKANNDSITKTKPFYQPEAVWLDQNIISKTIFFDPFDKYHDYTLKHSIFYRGKLDWILLANLKVVEKGMSEIKYSDHKALWIKVM